MTQHVIIQIVDLDQFLTDVCSFESNVRFNNLHSEIGHQRK